MAVLVGDDTQSGMLRVLVKNGRQEAEKQWRMRYPSSVAAVVASPVPVTGACVPGPLAAGVLPVSAPLSPVPVPPVAVQKATSGTVMVPVPPGPTDPQASAPAALLAGDVLLAVQTAVSDEDAEDSAPSLAVVRTEEETRAIASSLASPPPTAAEMSWMGKKIPLFYRQMMLLVLPRHRLPQTRSLLHLLLLKSMPRRLQIGRAVLSVVV